MDDLESLTDEIDAVCASELGETITYQNGALAPTYFKAHVFNSDGQVDVGAGQMIEQDIEIHIPKVSAPVMPNRSVRIQLIRHPGKTFYPTNPRNDDSGTHWIVNLKAVK